ncbi:MAG: hypothetical protein MK052_02690 [Alphaproteobacteria bacterium]|nr:hypothetical protein [Alphaproteobacteria bacterium]
MSAKHKLEPEEITMPRQGVLKSLFGTFMENAANKRIDKAIRQHATLPDGSMDTEMAAYIQKKMIQSRSIGIREVLGPGSWLISLSGVAYVARKAVMAYNGEKDGIAKISGKDGKAAYSAKSLAIVAGAVAIDAVRMRSKFNNSLTGELEGALGAMKAERYAERETERYLNSIVDDEKKTLLDENSGISLTRDEKQSPELVQAVRKYGNATDAINAILNNPPPESNVDQVTQSRTDLASSASR